MRVLVAGVDSLELGVYLRLSPSLLARLEQLRQVLRVAGGTTPHVLAGITVDVGFGGRGWAWRLACERWTVLIQPRGTGDLAPPCQVQFRAEHLWAEGPRVAVETWLTHIAPEIGSHVEKVIVSRVDLTADWDGWVPVPEDRSGFVRRSRFGVARLEEDHRLAERGELPMARVAQILRGEEGERYFEEHVLGRRFTGWSFGKGQLACRLYDKTAEIEKSKKAWFEEVWGRELHADEGPVWRCEFQLRREALKEFGVSLNADLWEKLPRLWSALAGGRFIDQAEQELFARGMREEDPSEREVGWLTLRTPTRGLTRSRWPVRPEWRELQESAFPLDGHPLVRVRRRKMDAERTRALVVRGMVRLAVLEGAPPPAREFEDELLTWFAKSDQVGEYLRTADVELRRLAAEYLARL